MANILLIEDYPGLQRVYKTILETAGHKVYVAANGEEGLFLADKFEVDLILVDILMPVMGGVEFMQSYNLKSHPSVKIIVLTNIYDDITIRTVKKLGASSYIIKADASPDEILNIIDTTLSGETGSKHKFLIKR